MWQAACYPLLVSFVLMASARAPGALPVERQALPVVFEPNLGQAASEVRFLGRAGGLTLLFAPRAITIATGETRTFHLRLSDDGSPAPDIVGETALPGRSAYFVGNDPRGWVTDVPHYAKIRYREIAPGVDLVFYGNGSSLEYDLVFAPGADPAALEMFSDGVESLDLGPDGRLVARGHDGHLIQWELFTREGDSRRQALPTALGQTGPRSADFHVPGFDRASPQPIDPTLSYCTYFGGPVQDAVNVMTVDREGFIYVSGWTVDPLGFPLQDPLFPDPSASLPMFVAKLDPTGKSLVYSTFLSGSQTELPLGIAAGADGSAYLLGTTWSVDFPVTPGVLGPTHNSPQLGSDCFVTRIAADGSALLYSTYLGGSGSDCTGNQMDIEGGIAVDPSGSAVVTGNTNSLSFPVVHAVQSLRSGQRSAFAARLDPTASSLIYSTYLGSSHTADGWGVAVDASGSAVVVGTVQGDGFPLMNPLQSTSQERDAFVTRLILGNLVYSTYLGGSMGDLGTAVALDAEGNAYVSGATESSDFPLVNPAQSVRHGQWDAFVSKLDPTGSGLVFSTYLAGAARTIAVDASGRACIAGWTSDPSLPVKDAFQPIYAGRGDVYVTCLTPRGNELLWASYLGGSHWDHTNDLTENPTHLALAPGCDLWIAGTTYSVDFPTTSDALQPALNGSSDGYLARISQPGDQPPASIGNTLLMVKEGGSIHCYWQDVTGAKSYPLFEDTWKGGSFAVIAGVGTAGTTGILLTFPASTRFYRVAGQSGCGSVGEK